ncbi:MAG: protein-L-isoaspartate(D-aspartate) O-methyltransferase [Acidobacteriota bacterium]|nr:protein-L-isoaspartate(D-aspartate) O-methyltransferase [Acidobacteriota bacterium]
MKNDRSAKGFRLLRWLPWLAALVLVAAYQLFPEGVHRLSQAVSPSTSQEPASSAGSAMPEAAADRVSPPPSSGEAARNTRMAWAQNPRDPQSLLRSNMVEKQIRARGVDQKQVLDAMLEVPRHMFVDPNYRGQAYDDQPVPIGWGQTVYQPYMVALMTELLELDGDEKVLEIGTGSGYHSAVLSRVAKEVYTIEINEMLSRKARKALSSLGYDNVIVREGDGYKGWPEEAPFDAIILTTAPPRIPDPLIEQLKVGGKMVVPIGGLLQDLQVLTKNKDGGVSKRTVLPVKVSTMTGEVQDKN